MGRKNQTCCNGENVVIFFSEICIRKPQHAISISLSINGTHMIFIYNWNPSPRRHPYRNLVLSMGRALALVTRTQSYTIPWAVRNQSWMIEKCTYIRCKCMLSMTETHIRSYQWLIRCSNSKDRHYNVRKKKRQVYNEKIEIIPFFVMFCS